MKSVRTSDIQSINSKQVTKKYFYNINGMEDEFCFKELEMRFQYPLFLDHIFCA